MAIRKIIEYPEPLLRLKAKKVDVFDDELKILTEDMAETMWEAPGIGLAAPQVAQSLRVIVVDITEPGEDKKHLALVNPEIVEHEGSQLDEEGCLHSLYDAYVEPTQLGQRQQQHVGDGLIQPPAQRRQDDDLGRAPARGVEERQLQVGLVLAGREADDLPAGRLDDGQLAGRDGIQVSDDDVGDHTQGERVPRPAVGRDDQVIGAQEVVGVAGV